MSVLTKETMVEAIQKSKATTISGVWRYLGHKSAISGGQSKHIKELVPNHMELLEANKKGILVEAEKTQVAQTETPAVAIAVPAPVVTPIVATVAPVAVTVPVVAPAAVVHKKAKVATTGKKEKVGGFRAGSNYAILFAEGSKAFVDKDELIANVAKMTGRSKELVTFDLNVMKYTDCKTNKGRAKIELKDGKKDGKIRIVPA